MIRLIFSTLAVFSIAVLNCWGQSNSNPGWALTSKLQGSFDRIEPGAAISALEFIKAKVQTSHIATPDGMRETLIRAFDKAKATTIHSNTQLYFLIAEILAGMKDGHTNINSKTGLTINTLPADPASI